MKPTPRSSLAWLAGIAAAVGAVLVALIGAGLALGLLAAAAVHVFKALT